MYPQDAVFSVYKCIGNKEFAKYVQKSKKKKNDNMPFESIKRSKTVIRVEDTHVCKINKLYFTIKNR